MPGRFIIEHKSKDRLIQAQATRFHLNWRKKDDFYPSYRKLISEFEGHYSLFEKYIDRAGLGPIVLNQWELTYIDSFPKKRVLADARRLVRSFTKPVRNLFKTDGDGFKIEHRAAEYSFEIQHKRGRLHIVAQTGHWGDDSRDSLLLHTTARGPIGKGGVTTLREGLDLGHDAAFSAFLSNRQRKCSS